MSIINTLPPERTRPEPGACTRVYAWTFNIVAREERGCIVAAARGEYIPYFIRAAAARTGFDREEMKGRSCLARLDHPSSLSRRIGKRKAAEAIYLLSHRGEVEERGAAGSEGREEKSREEWGGEVVGSGCRGGSEEEGGRKLLILKSSPSTVILTFSLLFHLIISAQNGGLLPSVLSAE